MNLNLDQTVAPESLISSAEKNAMSEAIDRAIKAASQSGKSGIAASILRDGLIVAVGENEVHLQCDPTKHAEMVAITRAAKAIDSTDLSGCVMVSTLQPCEMCLSAMRFAGIDRVIFAATQANVPSKYFVFPHLRIGDFKHNNNFEWVGGVDEHKILHLYAEGKE